MSYIFYYNSTSIHFRLNLNETNHSQINEQTQIKKPT